MNLLRRILVTVAGGLLLVAGLAMIVLPGPAVVVIPVALSVLAIEYLWAGRVLAWFRARFRISAAPADTERKELRS